MGAALKVVALNCPGKTNMILIHTISGACLATVALV